MVTSLLTRLAILLASLFLWNSAFAEFWAPVREQSYYGVQYVTGGIGSTEQEYLKSKEVRDRYNLEILTASKQGSYVSMAKVVVRSGDEISLSARMDGPMLLAALPDGRYQVEVTVSGEVQKRDVSLKQGRLRRVVTTWDVVAERLDKPEVSPEYVHPVVPETIDGIKVTTLPGVETAQGGSEAFSERQRKLEKARLLREQANRLEEEARRIEQSIH